MIPNFQDKITDADFPAAGQRFSLKFIQNYATMVAQLANFFRHGINIGDNMNAAWLSTESCTHATSTAIANPLRNGSAPKEVIVYSKTQPVKSWVWTYAAATNQILLTVNYDVPTAEITVSKSANQTLTTGAATAVAYGTTRSTVGGSLSFLSTKLISQIDGQYSFAYQNSYVASAAGTRDSWISKNGSMSGAFSRLSWQQISPAASGTTTISSSVTLDLAAGDYAEVYAAQSSGGNLDLQGNGTGDCYFQGRLVAWHPTKPPSDTPLVLVIGG